MRTAEEIREALEMTSAMLRVPEAMLPGQSEQEKHDGFTATNAMLVVLLWVVSDEPQFSELLQEWRRGKKKVAHRRS
jgi:hypothetical protein